MLACKAGGFAEEMIRKQRLRTTGRHFERANKEETGERKKEKGRGWGRGKRREEGGGGSGGGTSHTPPHPLPFSFFLSPVSPLFARSKWRPVVRNRCFRIISSAKPPALQAKQCGFEPWLGSLHCVYGALTIRPPRLPHKWVPRNLILG